MESVAGLVLVATVGLTLAQAMVVVVASQRVATMTAAAARAASVDEDAASAAREAAPTWLRDRLTVRRIRSGVGEEIRVRVVAPRIVAWWPDTTISDRVTVPR